MRERAPSPQKPSSAAAAGSGDPEEPQPPAAVYTSRKTDLLCFVTEPEEKRRIIGDTFMVVANKVMIVKMRRNCAKGCILFWEKLF